MASLEWEECSTLSLPRPQNEWGVRCVSLRDKVYVYSAARAEIYVSSSDLKSWSVFPTPTSKCGITTYRSELVLVGGMEVSKSFTNKLWTSNGGIIWLLSLPPMPTTRYRASAVSAGSPEYLIVAGGYGVNTKAVDVVEVLIERQWSTVEPLPLKLQICDSIFHDGNVYICTDKPIGWCCDLDSLVSSLQPKSPKSHDQKRSLWSKFIMRGIRSLVSLGHQFLVGFYSSHVSSSIAVYSSLTKSWVHHKKSPQRFVGHSTVLPTGEMIAIAAGSVFRISLKVSPYNADSQFSVSQLARLEAAGIKIESSLIKNFKQLKLVIGIALQEYDRGWPLYSPARSLEIVTDRWKNGEGQYPPGSWKSLLIVLQDMNLNELREQIEDYFASLRSLRRLCISVIVSSLLQQRSLKPEQLHRKLPHYVPLMTKRYIIQTFKAWK